MSDEMLVQLVDELADAVIVSDGEGTIIFWNAAAERLFGWSADDALGQTLDLIIPERLRNRHWDGFRRVMVTGQTDYAGRMLEVPALDREGRSLSIAFTVTLLIEPGETQPYAIAAVIRDDTERWQERRKMRQELESLRAGGSGDD